MVMMVMSPLVARQRRVTWLLPAVIAALGLASIACSVDQDVGTTALELSDASLTADAAVDSAADAGAPDDATFDAGPDANLILNAGFEDGVLSGSGNCGTGWDKEGTGTIATSPVAHSGSASCEVCATSSADAILRTTRPMPDAGSTLVPSAWLRSVDGTSLDGGAPTAFVYLNGCFPSCGPGTPFADIPDASTWLLDYGNQQLVAEAGQPVYYFEVHVDNGCMLVDDVTVVAQ
jgi:hypothetical protein